MRSSRIEFARHKMQQLLLKILSHLYGLIVRARNWLYDRGIIPAYRSRIPVISVGNLSVGGNGKTPLVLYLAEELQARGFRPVLLSRGYGGKLRGPYRVKTDDDPRLIGDEPLLLAQRSGCPVVVARRRVRGAKFIEDNKLGTVIILDDGFQHRRLARCVDIVTTNVGTDEAVEDFLRGDLLPKGRFREQRALALARADVLIFNERSLQKGFRSLDERLFKVVPHTVKLYRSFLVVKQIRRFSAEKGGEGLPPGEIVAFCGLANPEGFFQTLEQLGFSVKATFPFGDHHHFTRNDIEKIRKDFPGVPLVCTAKDAVKLDPSWDSELFVTEADSLVQPRDAFGAQLARMVLRAERSVDMKRKDSGSGKKSVSA